MGAQESTLADVPSSRSSSRSPSIRRSLSLPLPHPQRFTPGPPVTVSDDDVYLSTSEDPTYDLSSLLTATAVQIRAMERSGLVPILPIPETQIPSPLAEYISPERLLNLKEYLCGPTPHPTAKPKAPETGLPPNDGLLGPVSKTTYFDPEDNSIGSDYDIPPKGQSTNGPEIWASWKRAYDLWHGHYIEGRINKSWLGMEYLGIEEAINGQNKTSQDELTIEGGEYDDPDKWTTIENEDGIESRILNSNWAAMKEKKAIDGEMDLIGQGGGFYPMNKLKEFITPEDQAPEYVEGEDYSDVDVSGWTDHVQNTIWRPKRLGEDSKNPICEIDESVDTWFGKQVDNGIVDKTGYNGWVDGGFDCGRSPFPVLRPKVSYTHSKPSTKQHEYTKHLTWDGVTSTIFNMPMRPLTTTPEPQDLRLMANKTVYGDYFRNPLAESYGWMNVGTFPLDVRRILRKTTEDYMQDVNTEGEMVDLDDEFSLPARRNMQSNDPWYVTPEQQAKRVVPNRLQPPPMMKYIEEMQSLSESPKKGELFPVDSKNWRDEREKDDTWEAEYFITNLHGGTVLINGMEIRKGYTAGPLPAFAVIECPGGQIAFWWGVGGRDHGNCSQLKSDNWEALRAKPGWEYIGMLGGDVWREKIRERMEREKTGDDLWDDDLWAAYRAAWLKEKNNVTLKEATLEGVLEVWNGNFGTPARSFASPRDELKYLVLKTEVQRRQKVIEARSRGVIYPEGDAGWVGHRTIIKPALDTAIDEATDFWFSRSRNLITHQTTFAKSLRVVLCQRDEEEAEAAAQQGAELVAAYRQKKRNAPDDDDLPNTKRIRSDDEAFLSRYGSDMVAAARNLHRERQEQNDQIAAILVGQPKSEHKRIAAAYRQEQAECNEIFDKRTEEMNRSRAVAGLPAIPLRYPYPVSEIEHYLEVAQRVKDARTQASAQAAAQEQDKRQAIVRAHDTRLKLMELERIERARNSGGDATRQRRQAYEEKQRAGLDNIAKAKAAEEAKKKDAVREANFQRELANTRASRKAEYEFQREYGFKSGADSRKASGFGTKTGWGSKPGDFPDLKEALAASRALYDTHDQTNIQEGVKASLDFVSQYAERQEALENRAGASGLTTIEFVRREGYNSVAEYLNYETSQVADQPSAESMTEEKEFLDRNRAAYKEALQDGIKAVRTMNNLTVAEYLNLRGWNGSLAEFIENKVESSVTLDDRLVPIPKFVRTPPANSSKSERAAFLERSKEILIHRGQSKAENDARWKALQEKIFNAAEFECQIEVLERTDGAGIEQNTVFGKGLTF